VNLVDLKPGSVFYCPHGATMWSKSAGTGASKALGRLNTRELCLVVALTKESVLIVTSAPRAVWIDKISQHGDNDRIRKLW